MQSEIPELRKLCDHVSADTKADSKKESDAPTLVSALLRRQGGDFDFPDVTRGGMLATFMPQSFRRLWNLHPIERSCRNPVDAIKKAAQIEKLAHSVKSKLKQSFWQNMWGPALGCPSSEARL